MVKECSESGEISGVVEGIRTEAGRTLPLLRDKWKYAGIEGILQRGIEACIQVDQQEESKEELYLCPILQIQEIQSFA